MSLELRNTDIGDSIPLTQSEKQLKAKLEEVVTSGLDQFLKVALALKTLRDKRLYRQTHATFEDYVRDRFGLARSTIDQTIRSGSIAQSLLDSGCLLPTNVSEAVIRPLASLPDDDDLRASCWQLAEAFAPERGPTTRLVARLCHVVRECLEDPEPNEDEPTRCAKPEREGVYRGPKQPGHEIAFATPVTRLAHWAGFNPVVVVAGVDKPERAKNLYQSCSILADRCRLVQETLASHYPGLANA